MAYKIGELKILELRERAKTELGENFDIRAFHDAVLENGGIPLDILEARINRWIFMTKKTAQENAVLTAMPIPGEEP